MIRETVVVFILENCWSPFPLSRPEGVPRLFDLVKVQDEAVLPAFYYGLRDTLVAKDMDQATRIAYGATRYRVVTLGGELIDVSGTWRVSCPCACEHLKKRTFNSLQNTSIVCWIRCAEKENYIAVG